MSLEKITQKRPISCDGTKTSCRTDTWVTEEETADFEYQKKRIEKVREIFSDDLRLSIDWDFTAINFPVTTLHRIMHKYLCIFPYKLNNLHLIRQYDRKDRLRFSHYCQQHSESYIELLSRILLTDECMFRLNDHVTTQNTKIRRPKSPT